LSDAVGAVAVRGTLGTIRGAASMKRFVIGFVLGVGLMYYYLHYTEIVQADATSWFKGAASKYRDDKQHQAARDVLGESEHRH
jgi:hypothetical protein